MVAHNIQWHPDWTNRPVLIYGPRKAGTTLALSLIDGIQDVLVCPSELKLKFLIRHVWRGERNRLAEDFLSLNNSAGLNVPNVERDTYVDRFKSLVESSPDNELHLRSLIQCHMAALAEALDPSTEPMGWIAKEVGGEPSTVVGTFRSLFPWGKVVLIDRAPDFVYRSVVLDRRRRGRNIGIRQKAKEAIAPLRITRQYARLTQNSDVIRISYEDLVSSAANREKAMCELCEFLRVPTDEGLLKPTFLGEPTIVPTASQATQSVFPQAESWKDGLGPFERCIYYGARFGWKAMREKA